MFQHARVEPVKVPIFLGVNLSTEQCPKTQEEIKYMAHVPYASAIGSMIYAMFCTREDISHVVGVLRRYTPTPRKEHWNEIKRFFKYFCGMTYYPICCQGNLKLIGK